MQEDSPVIIDNGTFSIKSGLVFQERPNDDTPNVIGHLKHPFNTMCLIVPNLAKEGSVLDIQYPVMNGLVENWQNMQKVWEHMFNNELRVIASEHPTILIQSQRHPPAARQKIAQIMFEKFETQKFYFTNQFISSLYHNQNQAPDPQLHTGVVVNSSHLSTQIVPIINSKIIDHAVITLAVGGSDVEEYFQSIYKQYQFNTFHEKQIRRNIKEKIFYVSIDPKNEKPIEKQYYYGKDLTQTQVIGFQRFQSCEVMFRPELLWKISPSKLNKVQMGVHEAIFSSVMNINDKYHDDLLGNIVLNGGNMMFPGMTERLQKELEGLISKNMKNSHPKVVINAPKQTKYTSYFGVQKMSTNIQQNQLWFTKQQYEQIGPNIILQQKICQI